MIPFVSSVAGALFSFIGAKVINYGTMVTRECSPEDDEAPLSTQNQRSFEGADPLRPSCQDYIHFFCETPPDTDAIAPQTPLSCTEKVMTIFSRYLKQIGYTLTTVGGAALGAVLSSSPSTDVNQDTPSFIGVYLSSMVMLLGTVAVAQANVRYRCSEEEEPQREVSRTYGSLTPSTPITLSPESYRVLTIHA